MRERWLRKLVVVAAEKAGYNRRSLQGREGPRTRSGDAKYDAV